MLTFQKKNLCSGLVTEVYWPRDLRKHILWISKRHRSVWQETQANIFITTYQMLILQWAEVVKLPHSLTEVPPINDISFISFINISWAYLVQEYHSQFFHVGVKYSLSGFLSLFSGHRAFNYLPVWNLKFLNKSLILSIFTMQLDILIHLTKVFSYSFQS